jgi:hypothetical protein
VIIAIEHLIPSMDVWFTNAHVKRLKLYAKLLKNQEHVIAVVEPVTILRIVMHQDMLKDMILMSKTET